MYDFNNLIDDLEEGLFCEIDYPALARKCGVSLYEFRRIFSFIAKVPIGEYVRKRRLSLAAVKLKNGETVTEVASECGYDSPSAFTRAFKDFHGITPGDVLGGNRNFRAFTRLNAEIITGGAFDIPYEIFGKDSFVVSGISGVSDMDDKQCCENVWNKFYSSPVAEKITDPSRIFAVYQGDNNGVNCLIGTDNDKFGDKITVKKSEWAKFKLNRTDDEFVDKFYRDALRGWLVSTGLKRNEELPNVEVFPCDMNSEGFEWEIWIPIK